jgi:nucleoside-diphosphate-sugar epimerase
MRDVLSGKNITMYSDGSPSRTFCYIADAITGYFKILVNGKPGEPYNIGNSEPEITMKELAEKIVLIGGKLLNYNGKVEYASSNDSNYLVDNPNRRCPDITKAQTELSYNPSMGLEEGLSRNLIWHNSNRGKAN